MYLRKLVLTAILTSCGFAMKAQEYYQHVSIKKDSVYDGSIRLLGRLQQSGSTRSDEAARNYRDSLMTVLRKTDTSFRSPEAISRVRFPHPAYRIISDIAWNDFKVSPGSTTAIQLLQQLAAAYPAEQYIQGNLALAYERTGRSDSANAVIDRFLSANQTGFNSIHLQKNIIRYKWNQLPLSEIVNLGTDSFNTWINNATYPLPAALDSLRNALAVTIIHRIGTNSNDTLLAQLIFDYADLTAKDKSYLLAIPFYKEAVRHNPALETLAEDRQATIGEIDESVGNTFKWASVIYAVPLLALVFILIIWLKNRNRNPDGEDTRIN